MTNFDGLMPCGKKDCTECESCKYDMPLDLPHLKIKDLGMRNYGLMPVGDNPSTSQIIIPGAAARHHIGPFSEPSQLSLPFPSQICRFMEMK
jgi:hypothetical protein